MLRLTAFLAIGCAWAVTVWSQPEPVLTIGFDEGFDGVGPGGAVKGSAAGKPELVPGRTGQALKSGPATGYVEYPTAGIVNAAAGTVEMWVCPLDWTPGDNAFHVFFDARGPGGALYLYKYYQGSRALMLTCPEVNGPYFSSGRHVDWPTGSWHHVAGTWSAEGVMLYVDGQPAGKVPVAGMLPSVLGKTFRIGDHPWDLPRTSASLVDDVRIYDHALNPSHIAAHFQGKDDHSVPLDEKTMRLHYEIDPEKNEADVRVSTGGADVEDRHIEVAIALVPKNGEFPDPAVAHPFAAGIATAMLPLPLGKPGDYEVVARVRLTGKQVAELRQELVIPDTSWLGTSLGREDKVLPPWSPLELGGRSVRCWGREYTLGQAGLPVHIKSGGEELLAAPIHLIATRNGQPIEWVSAGAPPRLSPARTRAEWSGMLTDEIGGGAARIEVRAWMEYDGLLMVELLGNDARTLPLDSLSLDLPLEAGHAIYRHYWSTDWKGSTKAGALPGGKGAMQRSPFIPFYWLGDNDRGLFWFCESDEFWPNSECTNAIEVVRVFERGKEEVVLRLNLLAKGQKLPANWRFAFGLQATPVKPVPKDWRKWRLLPAKGGNVSIPWPEPKPTSLRYFGYPEAWDPPTFAKRIAGLHEKGVQASPYLALAYCSVACPEWRYFGKRWAMGPSDPISSDVAAYKADFAMGSSAAAGYADFQIAKTTAFIDRYKIDGLYHDNTYTHGSDRAAAGMGYVRNGQRRPTYPILSMRDMYRRMYAVMKGRSPGGFTMAHMSTKVMIPVLASLLSGLISYDVELSLI